MNDFAADFLGYFPRLRFLCAGLVSLVSWRSLTPGLSFWIVALALTALAIAAAKRPKEQA